MKATQQLVLTAAICGVAQISAFVPASQPKNPTAVSAVDVSSVIDPSVVSDPTVLIAGAGAAVAAGIASLGKVVSGKTATSSSSTKEPKVDLSIPYDAAATLAYNAYAESSSKKVNFKEFQEVYYAQMVAEVKAKSQLEKVNEKKSDVDALQKQLATLEAELAGLKGDMDGFNDEAAGYKSQIQEMF